MTDYLIIGADAAGLSAAVQIKRRQPQASIKVISKGRIISYGACGIPYVLSGDIPSEDDLIHFTPESFEKQRGIPVHVNREATAVFPHEHTVEIKNLETGETSHEAYEKLLIATGAHPRNLPAIDTAVEGIFNLHTIQDLQQVLNFLQKKSPRTAAVIGAGNIGLELVEALHKRGIKILLFDIAETPALVWPTSIREAVIGKLKEKEVLFSGNTTVNALEMKGEAFVLDTSSGEYKADILFSVAGTRPASEFCEDSLDTLGNGAIQIDRHGRTSAEDIYAAGDCASVYHRILDRNVYFPLGSTANKMGRISGLNMAGESVEFPGIVGTQIFKFFELSLAKTGLTLKEAEREGREVLTFSAGRPDKASYYPGAEKVWVEIVCEKDTQQIIGASAICSGNAAQFIDPAAVAIFFKLKASQLAWFDFAYAPPYAPVWNALLSASLKAARI